VGDLSVTSFPQEYASSGDQAEVARILRDLAVPFFHHELVKQVGGAGRGAGVAGLGSSPEGAPGGQAEGSIAAERSTSTAAARALLRAQPCPQALLLGMDSGNLDPWLALLGKLNETGEVSASQMTKVGLRLRLGKRQAAA
jgi:hypothetical protein